MKPATLLTLLLLQTAGLHAEATPDSSGVLSFFNKNQVPGKVVGIEKELIRWDSPQLQSPAPFFLNQVLEFHQTAQEPEPEGTSEAVVSLTNGDSLRGQLASVTDQTVELNTWYAGKLLLKRPMVDSVRILDRPRLIYRGPTNLDGWNRPDSSSSWSYESGKFVSKGAGHISRDLKLPPSVRISFDLAWRSSLRFRVMLFSDNVESKDPSNTYDFFMQRKYVYLRKRWTDARPDSNILGNTVSIPEFGEKEKVHIDILADRRSGNFQVVVDGRIAGTWNDPDFKTGKFGGGLHFVAEDSTPLQLSRIEVSPWDGVIEQPQDSQDPFAPDEESEEKKPEKPKPEVENGRMLLRNGDSISGEILSIADGKIRIRTPLEELTLPVSRLRTIALKPVSREEAILRNGDIRAWFPDGSRIVFRLDEASPNGLTGQSQNFGTATFKQEAFSRIEFNLYDPKYQNLRGERLW